MSLVGVGVTAQGVDLLDARADRLLLAEDGTGDTPSVRYRPSVCSAWNPTKRTMFAGFDTPCLQVVQHPPAFAHPRRRDDDEGPGLVVERLRFVDAPRRPEPRERERRVARAQLRQRVLAVAFDVTLVHLRDAGRERTVHDDRHVGELPRTVQLVEQVKHLLCASDGERGDDELRPPSSRDLADEIPRAVRNGRLRLVHPVAVGAFGDERLAARTTSTGSRRMGMFLRPRSPVKRRLCADAVLR